MNQTNLDESQSKSAGSKRAFLVLGPESSGTKYLTDLFVKAGCEGSGEHHQPFDKEFNPKGDNIVWRRSYRMAGVFPRADSLAAKCQVLGYEVTAVVILRDMCITANSQLRNGHVKDIDQAWEQIRKSHTMIFDQIKNLNHVVVSYESLVMHPNYVLGWLSGVTGLGFPQNTVTIDGNRKYVEG